MQSSSARVITPRRVFCWKSRSGYQQALKLDGLVHACGGDIHKAGQVAILAVAEQALSELNPYQRLNLNPPALPT